MTTIDPKGAAARYLEEKYGANPDTVGAMTAHLAQVAEPAAITAPRKKTPRSAPVRPLPKRGRATHLAARRLSGERLERR